MELYGVGDAPLSLVEEPPAPLELGSADTCGEVVTGNTAVPCLSWFALVALMGGHASGVVPLWAVEAAKTRFELPPASVSCCVASWIVSVLSLIHI